jgi:hypothetical protein
MRPGDIRSLRADWYQVRVVEDLPFQSLMTGKAAHKTDSSDSYGHVFCQ